MVAKPVEKLLVGGLGRDGDVDQRQAESQRDPRLKIWIDEGRPLGGELFGRARVSVTGKVYKKKLSLRLAGPPEIEEIDGLGAPGGVTGLGDLASDERIDEARLADVGAAQESDFGSGGGRELPGIGRAEDEPGLDFHFFTMAGG